MNRYQYGGTYYNLEKNQKCTRYYPEELELTIPHKDAVLYEKHTSLLSQGNYSVVMLTTIENSVNDENKTQLLKYIGSTSWKEINQEALIQQWVYLASDLAPAIRDFFLCEEGKARKQEGVIVMDVVPGTTLNIFLTSLSKQIMKNWIVPSYQFITIFGQLYLMNYIFNVGMGVIHNDLHDKNIMVNADTDYNVNTITYIDYGKSKTIVEPILSLNESAIDKRIAHIASGTIDPDKTDNNKIIFMIVNLIVNEIKSLNLRKKVINIKAINEILEYPDLESLKMLDYTDMIKLSHLLGEKDHRNNLIIIILLISIYRNIFQVPFEHESSKTRISFIDRTKKCMNRAWIEFIDVMRSCNLLTTELETKILEETIGVFDLYYNIINHEVLIKFGMINEP